MDHSASIRTHYRSCALCEAACGIEVTVDDAERRILSVRADKDDPLSKGFLCAKAIGLKALHEDPDRLRQPLRRKGRDFEEIGWDEALDEAGARLRAIQKEHGADSVGYYFGNPTGHKPADRIFDVMVRSGPVGDAFGLVSDGLTLERVKQQPHGLDHGPHGEQLPGVLKTPDRLIDLAPQRLIDDVQRMEQWLNESEAPDSLVMIGRRHIRSKNAWTHNLHFLVKGKPRCTLLIHPRDAQQRGLVSGDAAAVRTHIAAVEALVEVSDEVMPGVVSLPHGWGHGLPGTRQRVAKDHPGVNANAIIDELLLDEPSASTVLNGVPVQVTRVAGNTRASSQVFATGAN